MHDQRHDNEARESSNECCWKNQTIYTYQKVKLDTDLTPFKKLAQDKSQSQIQDKIIKYLKVRKSRYKMTF